MVVSSSVTLTFIEFPENPDVTQILRKKREKKNSDTGQFQLIDKFEDLSNHT